MEVPGNERKENVHPRSLLADLRVCHEDRAVVGASEAAAGGRDGGRESSQSQSLPMASAERGETQALDV